MFPGKEAVFRVARMGTVRAQSTPSSREWPVGASRQLLSLHCDLVGAAGCHNHWDAHRRGRLWCASAPSEEPAASPSRARQLAAFGESPSLFRSHAALHRGPMAVRWMGTPIGAETRFAEALKTGQYVPLPKLRELRAEARDIAAERREEERANAAGSSSSGKQDQQQQRKGRDSNDGSAGVLSDGRVLATPKGPAPQGKKSAQPQQHKQ